MNMIAAPDITAATRIDLRDLDDMPVDMVALTAAMRDLTARELGVWLKLRAHFWMYGTLPAGPRALAKVGGLGPKSFDRVAEALARHFDRTEHGAWCDHRLARARGKRIIVPSAELPPVDPSLSETRRAIGSRGGKASGESRRRAAAGVGGLLQSEANDEANGGLGGGAGAGRFASSGEASGSLTRGWLVGSSLEDSSKTNQPTAPAGAPAEAKPPASSEAKPPADPEAKSDEPKPDEAPDPEARARDAQMAKAITAACPGKVAQATALWGAKTVRAWIAKGCSFEADYLPSLKSFASTNSEVRNVANPKIEAATFHARDVRLAGGPGRLARPDLTRASPATRALHAAFEAQVGEAVYKSWGGQIELLAIDGDTARLAVPTRFIKTRLGGELERELLAAARAVEAGIERVAIEVRPPGPG